MINNDEEKAKLMHFGILGMKWGRRRAESAANASSRDAADLRKHGYKEEAKAVQKVANANRRKANELGLKIALKRTGTKLKNGQEVKTMSSKQIKEMMDSPLMKRKLKDADRREKAGKEALARMAVVYGILGLAYAGLKVAQKAQRIARADASAIPVPNWPRG